MCKELPKLTTEGQALVENNFKHATWLAHKWYETNKKINVDELISLALFGLTKAAATYDKTRAQFNTYARFIIENEFKNELKKTRKYSVGVFESDEDEEDVEQTDVDQSIDLKTAISKLPKQYQDILLDFYEAGHNQYQIADKYNISQPKVSVILNNSRELIASYMKY
jgi:RNA polymerase sigma factor (sigma-70 family)